MKHSALAQSWLRRVFSLISFAIFAFGDAPAQAATPPRSFPESESPELIGELNLTLFVLQPVGGIFGYDIPEMVRRTVRPYDRRLAAVHFVSEADAQGRVAFVIKGKTRSYEIHRLEPDGTEPQLFSGPGDPLWDHSLTDITLAVATGRIAYVTKPDKNLGQKYKPLLNGPLKLLEPSSDQPRVLVNDALARRASWFPEGRRLAYIAPAGPLPAKPDSRLKIVGEVRTLDVETGASVTLGPGSEVWVSSDGTRALIERGEGTYALVETASGRVESLPTLEPKAIPLALIRGRYVIYKALPTPGRRTAKTSNNSFLVGPKDMLAIKVVDLSTGKFVTLVPLVDPRHKVAVSPRKEL